MLREVWYLLVLLIIKILIIYVTGPDAQDTVQMKHGRASLTFFGSELRLRGDQYISQPHRDNQGNILCWNGEVSGIQSLKFL